jgi:hypothetical protein
MNIYNILLNSIVTSLILEEFWLDCEVRGKTVIQTRMEKRIIECSLHLKEEIRNEDEKWQKVKFLIKLY